MLLYYQNKETKKTFKMAIIYDNPIHALKDFRGLWGKEYYFWLGAE